VTAATDRWASFPGPRKLLVAARALLQEQRTGAGVVVRADLTAPERAQVARYLGLDWEVSGRPVTLGRLRTALSRAGDDLDGLLTRTAVPAVDDGAGRRPEQADLLRAIPRDGRPLLETVLVLNLPLTGKASATKLWVAGEPVWLTARSLRGGWSPAAGVDEVRVCGNPAVVEAAADRWGTACRPLVCVDGRPSPAARSLLRGLAHDGVRLLVTTDRDDAGRQILADLLALPGAAEWRPGDLDALVADLAS
jgi:hypothetical protein